MTQVRIEAEAPGKAFLIGEYLALEGGPAVVAALNRVARARFSGTAEAMSPLVRETIKTSLAAIFDLKSSSRASAIEVDTDSFQVNGTKLGIGSSAAASVASVGLLFEDAGLSIDEHRSLVLQVATRAHTAAQGGVGSGADLAAATYGGLIQFNRESGYPIVKRLQRPASLSIIFFWTGRSVGTVDMVGQIRRFAEREGATFAALMAEMRIAAREFLQAMTPWRPAALLDAVKEYGRLLRELGGRARVDIVTQAFSDAMSLADALGGAAKPSGAGGGDIGVAFFSSAQSAREFATRCSARVQVLDVRVASHGVRVLRDMPAERKDRDL